MEKWLPFLDEVKVAHGVPAPAPEITVLLRIQTFKDTAPYAVGGMNAVRLGRRYRPFSDDSLEFYRHHVVMVQYSNSDRSLAENAQDNQQDLIIYAPATFDRRSHIRMTKLEIDRLFKCSHDHLTRDAKSPADCRAPIGYLQLQKFSTDEPFDTDCLYMLTMEVFSLAMHYGVRSSRSSSGKRLIVRIKDLSEKESCVVFDAVSNPFTLGL